MSGILWLSLALAVLTLGLVIALFEGDDALAPERTSSVATERELLRPESAGLQDPGTAVAKTGDATVAERSVVPGERRAPAPGNASVTGRLVVTDEEGNEREARRGKLGFDTEAAGRRYARVSRGLFSLDVPLGTTLTPAWVGVDGRVTTLVPADPIRVDSDVAITVHARCPAATWLHVRDSETDEELSKVIVIEADPRFTELAPYGGRHTQVGRLQHDGVPSPIEYPRRRGGEDVLWVGGEGYAWERVAIDLASSGDRFVHLSPACGLDVTFSGSGDVPERESVFVELLHRDRPSSPRRSFGFFLTEDVEDWRVAFEDIPPGDYLVTAQLGDPEVDQIALGRVASTVRVGGRTSAHVDLRWPPRRREVPLLGTLEVPRAWDGIREEREGDGLVLYRRGGDVIPSKRWKELVIGDMEVIDPEVRRWRFDAGTVVPGTYEWSVDSVKYDGLLVVPEGGLGDARLLVPPPATLTVRCVDAVTRAPVGVGRLSWVAVDTEDIREVMEEPPHVSWRSRDTSFVLTVPQSRVLLMAVSGDGHDVVHRAVDVDRPEVEVTLELTRRHRLVVRLRVGETRVPIVNASDVRIERVGGGAADADRTFDGAAVHLYLKSPGRYLVTGTAPEGFIDPSPTEVHVDGASTELLIPILRR